MILENLFIHGSEGVKRIEIHQQRIGNITDCSQSLSVRVDKKRILFNQATAFPGLINSHDHLDFNLFPALATRKYDNYAEWGHDIHVGFREIIELVKRVPPSLRLEWGQYKNLLNGFTTVVEHGRRVRIEKPIITIFQNCYCLHSPAFETNWKWKLNHPLKIANPVVMHIGEGRDGKAAAELDEVIRKNFLKKRIVAVHGIAMNVHQAHSFSALVWCPASNYFLIGETARVKELRSSIRILFGTDSTLTSSWNAWDHFRLALGDNQCDEADLFSMLTDEPAKCWGMHDRGKLAPGKFADIVVARASRHLFSLDPPDILLVIQDGKIRLFDQELLSQLSQLSLQNYSRIWVDHSMKYVEGSLAETIKKIKKYSNEIRMPVHVD
jgi:cytosine/adenosine deaminase-related metal-dependent hydrolase